MRRGEIRPADLSPSRGAESDKSRPVLIVSNNGANFTAAANGRGVLTVVPLTSRITHLYAFQVLLEIEDSGLRVDSKVQCEQVRSIDVERLGGVIGRVSLGKMQAVDSALRLHLAL